MRILRYFARAYPWESLIVLVCLVLAALVDGLGVSTMLPMLSLVVGGEDRSQPSELERVVERTLTDLGIQPTLGVLVAIIVEVDVGQSRSLARSL